MSKGAGITFVDIDETLFKTFAQVHVLKNDQVIKKLHNQEFNTYTLQEGEEFEFSEFKDGKLFLETSIPITQTITRIKNMISEIQKKERDSKIIFLTARKDFDDKDNFLDTFRAQGIDIDDKKVTYIERSGNLKKGSIAEKKKKIILNYLAKKKYARCRMIDDDTKNINEFIQLAKEYCFQNKHEITFFALQVHNDGHLELVEEVNN